MGSFKTRTSNGRQNLCGLKIAKLRNEKEPYCSQKVFADLLQLRGVEVTKNTIQSIESGQRFVTDIELKQIAKVLGVTTDELLREEGES